MIYDENITICSGYLCPLAEYCVRWKNGIAYDYTVQTSSDGPRVRFMAAKYNDKTNKCVNFLNFFSA